MKHKQTSSCLEALQWEDRKSKEEREYEEGGMDGWNALAGSACRASKGTRQTAQGHFLFLWTLQSETPFFSEVIKNGLGQEVRDEGGRIRGTEGQQGVKQPRSVIFGL